MSNGLRRSAGVLIAEDDEAMLDGLTSILENEGYYVKAARNGVEAVLAFIHEADRIDMAVIDVCMPYLDGLNTMKIIRAVDAGIPMLVTTAMADPKLAALVTSLGGKECLAKPFRREQLLEMVRKFTD